MPQGLGTAVGVRLARMLYRRWEALDPADRAALEPLAADVKRRALDVRGTVDDGRAEQELDEASTELAGALGADEVATLREELRSELERVERDRRRVA